MSVTVEATGVCKSYRDGARTVEVLRGVDFSARAGEIVAVVGPSGSGKSTLLHLLGALDTCDQGAIAIGGQALDRLDPKGLAAFRNRTIGFIFQFHRLLPDFDALENVMLPGRIAGQDPSTVAARAAALLDEVGLSHRVDHFPNQLSGGERQRVALCRALLMKPPLLLADEPTGNLDPASAGQVFDLLLGLQEKHHTTAVLVTHNPALAARCGRIFRLDGGVLCPESTLRSPIDRAEQPVGPSPEIEPNDRALTP